MSFSSIILFVSVLLTALLSTAATDIKYQKAKIICDDEEAAREFIKESMFLNETTEEPYYVFYPKKYSSRDMVELINSGKMLKCFARHTTRPSAYNKAYFKYDLQSEEWPPYKVEYKIMDVDYVSHISERVVIFLTTN